MNSSQMRDSDSEHQTCWIGSVTRTKRTEGSIGVDGVSVAVPGVEGWLQLVVVAEEHPADCKVVGPVWFDEGMDVAPAAVSEGAVTDVPGVSQYLVTVLHEMESSYQAHLFHKEFKDTKLRNTCQLEG
eukprot:g9625.t1